MYDAFSCIHCSQTLARAFPCALEQSAPVFQRPLRHADCFQVHMRSRVSDRVVGDAEDGEKRGGAQRDARAPCIGKAVWPDWTWPRRGTGAWMWNWTREQQFMASPSTAFVRSSGVFAAPFRTAHFAQQVAPRLAIPTPPSECAPPTGLLNCAARCTSSFNCAARCGSEVGFAFTCAARCTSSPSGAPAE